jgi:zinc finger SWIM domain-containing protein 3
MYFYAIQIDEPTGKITNFFWANGQSIMDYKCFGDVVSFDTTFHTNKFEMPFAPLLETSHHKQTIIFGAALMFDETIPSFIWLFETFLTAMGGKQPSTIFTDQDAAMAGAIAYVLPNTSHQLCLWHIYLNASKHLSHVIHTHPQKFQSDFKSCVYEDRIEECFKTKWNELLTKYNLHNNSWMQNLYALRKKWVVVTRDSFTADITTTQRSEGMNNVFKKRFHRKFGLSELIVECEKVSASLRENELDEDFKSRTKNLVNYIPDFPLKTASYTRRMYSEFEEEFKCQFSFSCKLLEIEGSKSTFMVTHMHSDCGANVVFNSADNTVTCSCRKFESTGMGPYLKLICFSIHIHDLTCIFVGILCKHAFKVFNMNDVFILPAQYILNRWIKYAKRGFYIDKKEMIIKT